MNEAQRPEPIFNPQAVSAWPVLMLVASFVAIQVWIDYAGVAEANRIAQTYGFYSGQFWAGLNLETLISYAFLHAGWLHLGMNGAACLGLGFVCWQFMGTARFFLLFLVTAIAGAIAFAAVRPETGPLVGASGAIFGLLAVVKRIEFQKLARRGHGFIRPSLIFAAQMIALNVVIGILTGGLMAWEAHLGGMAAGWLIAPYLIRRDAL